MPKENVEALLRLNQIQEDLIRKLRAENNDLKKKLEMLKDFEFLRMLFK